MVDVPPIDDLIRRVRAGDQAAAAVLVERYEPAIRRAVRFRLADARLGNVFDSMDICQSVLGSFFIRAANGQYNLETPKQLLKLLTTMARNKLISQARKQHAQRRDGRRITSSDGDDGQFVSARPGPSKQVAVRDLLQEVQNRLSPEERRILELKNEGQDWATIASMLQGSAEALRRKLSRALGRVAEQLGLDDTQ
ncbi:MAG TPA: sigma-70 family RNA polymerase sigma factor [Isosphaeraceae bacterium]|jgi:RNA polymerase sigma-70 factor (ECF subfamily)|nr:sigma-70 family RNA polymerase sigma factor [Isosphaeraceae bacterium]